MSSEKPNFLSQPVVKNIFMFRNGDPYYEARRIVINQKRISNFETLLREVTGGIQAPFGAVRNIYTPTGGHRVDCMESLKSGEQYVAAGREKFKRLDYRQIGLRRRRMMQTLPTQAKPLPQNRILVSARFLKPIKEPCTIFVVANGDVLDPATRLLIHQKILQQFDRILEMVTEKMGLRVLGGVRSLYTYEGQQVTDGNQLESGQLYVAVGRERFKKLPYSDMLFTKPRGTRRVLGMKAHSLPPIYRFSKHNGIIKSVGRNSDSGDQDFKISPQRRNCSNKEHLSSIVREISQARLISLRKNRSGQSMTLSMSDNVDLESKADDGLLEVKTPPDQPADKEPEDDDAKAAEENSEKAGEEEEEAAPKTTTEEDTSTNKEDEEENQETNDKKEEGGENKENDEAKGTEVTAGSREKQEEVDHEPTEEFIRESKEAPRKEEQRYGEKEEDGKLQGTDETKEELKVEEERYGEKEEEMEEGVKEQDTDDGKEELKEEEQRYGEEEEDVEEGGKEQGTDESQEELKEEEQRYAEKEEEVEERVKEQGTDESKEALKEEDQTYGEEEVEEGVNEQGTNKTKEELKKEEQSYGEEEVKEEVKEQGTYETKVELKEEGQMYGEKEEEVKEEVKEQGTYETKEELKKEEQSSGGKEEEFQEEVKGEVMVESKEDVKADEQECSSSNSDQTDDCLDKEDGNHPSPGYDQGGQDKNTEGEEQDKDSGKGRKSNEDPDKDIGEGKKEEEMENTNDPGKSRSDNKREESDSIRSSSRYSNQGEDVSKTKEGATKEPGQWE